VNNLSLDGVNGFDEGPGLRLRITVDVLYDVLYSTLY
jgi:hypothetical protein